MPMGDATAAAQALAQWLQRLESASVPGVSSPGMRMALDDVRAVAQAMSFDFNVDGLRLPCHVVVVGGTNGKGSTCAFLDAIATQAGYRTAVYSSPHLLRFEERLRIQGQDSDASDWVRAFEAVGQATETAGASLTYFEWVTLAAFDMVRRQPPNLAIFEIGMGGRLDAVNLLANDAAVLTSIDLDHQAFLGSTREQIGWEKAHIARPGRPLIVGDPLPPVTVAQVAQTIGADLWQFGVDFNYQGDRQQWSWRGRGHARHAMAYPALRGINQLLNASAALAALAALQEQLPVNQGAVRAGLGLVSLPGRFQVLPGQPAVVLDVGHNPHAAGVLASNLDQMGFFPRTLAVVGMLADKDAEGVFAPLVSKVDTWFLASLEGEGLGGRAQRAQRLAERLAPLLLPVQAARAKEGLPAVGVQCLDTPAQAFAAAAAQADPSDRLVVFGSFVTVAAVWPAAQQIGQAPHAPRAPDAR